MLALTLIAAVVIMLSIIPILLDGEITATNTNIAVGVNMGNAITTSRPLSMIIRAGGIMVVIFNEVLNVPYIKDVLACAIQGVLSAAHNTLIGRMQTGYIVMVALASFSVLIAGIALFPPKPPWKKTASAKGVSQLPDCLINGLNNLTLTLKEGIAYLTRCVYDVIYPVNGLNLY